MFDNELKENLTETQADVASLQAKIKVLIEELTAEKAKQEQLNAQELALAKQAESLTTTEQQLAEEKQAFALAQEQLKPHEESLKAERKALNSKSLELAKQELTIKNGLPEYFEEQFASFKITLAAQQQRLIDETKKFEQDKHELSQRELKIQEAELKQQLGFTQLKEAQEQELLAHKQAKLAEITDANEALMIQQSLEAEQRLQVLHKQFAEQQQKLSQDHEELRANLQKKLDQQEQQTKSEIEALRAQFTAEKTALNEQKAELEAQQEDLDFQRRLNKQRQEKLDNQDVEFEQKINHAIIQRQRSFEAEEQRLTTECERLRADIDASHRELSLYQELKQKLDGQAPEMVLAEFQRYKEEIKQLKQDLLDRPQAEIKALYDQERIDKEQLNAEVKAKLQKISQLEQSIRDQDAASFDIIELKERNKQLQVMYEANERRCNELKAELDRLSPSAHAEQNRNERLQQIQMPLIDLSLEQKYQLMGFQKDNMRNEIDWLKNIYQQCADYGITFNPRILFAFHTALKSAEMSPITVLAGVSGTGKSELPRLYSRFGGINFLNLPVQPNWDSQESMLGFFNSIDNCFDAQPVLRLLAQSQIDCTEFYPGLAQGVNIVLLDEMNLAHVELYFADFLSKLEQRRGSQKSKLPSLDIKLGSGIDPYQLPLGRNVLWVGTMNQDETTKALSDKVLDRGIAIHFPRPQELHSRKLKMMPEQAPLLNIREWANWVQAKVDLPEASLVRYKKIIEQLNSYMANVGRALGHRVWQSIEYYMSNYPMISALHDQIDTPEFDKWLNIAFEDQLVQKVMPKLRGIETRGLGKTDCLEPIRQLLVDEGFNITDDFDRACKFGYGQFIWSTAEYLNDTSMFQSFTQIDLQEQQA